MIIGLSGYARSGKDEIAKILIEDYSFIRVGFADKIRQMLVATNPLVKEGLRLEDVVENYGWEQAKVIFPEVRTLLQNMGVGARNIFKDTFWIDHALEYIDSNHNYVITDVRFINEAETIKSYADSQIWRIRRIGVEAVNNHISEHDLDDYKFNQIIKNEGTLEDLRAKIHNRMEFSLNAN